MKLKLNDDSYSKLIVMVRKKFKFAGANSILLDDLELKVSGENLIIFFKTNNEVSLTPKAKKNLGKAIAEFLFKEKACKKYSNTELEFTVQYPSSGQSLIKSLSNLEPNIKTDVSTKNSLSIYLTNGKLIQKPVLITIISNYLWPELCGKNIEKLYRSESHHLNPKFPVESNAYEESQFIFQNYKTLLIKMINFFDVDIIQFCNSGEYLFKNEKPTIKLITSYLVELHQFEFKLTNLWERHEYLLERLEILKRVCHQLDYFYDGLISSDIDASLWQERETYLKIVPECNKTIQVFIQKFCYSVEAIESNVEQLTTNLNYRQSICEQESTERKLIKGNNKKELAKVNVEPQELSESGFGKEYMYVEI